MSFAVIFFMTAILQVPGDFPTISAACAAAKSGDRVVVAKGVYRETVTVPPGVTLDGQSVATIHGCNVVTAKWQSYGVGIWSVPHENRSDIVFLNGRPLRQLGKFEDLTPPAWKPAAHTLDGDWRSLKAGEFSWDKQSGRLFIAVSSEDSPDGMMIEAASRSVGVILNNGSSLTGFRIVGHQAEKDGPHYAVRASADNLTISDCEILHNDFAGIIAQGNHIVIKDCVLTDNGNCAVTGSFGRNMRFEGNRTARNNTRGYDGAWQIGGIKMHQLRDSQILHHRAEDEEIGIWLDISCANILVAESTLSRCGTGIFYEISRWGIIVNNTLAACPRAIWVSTSSDVLVAHNVISGGKDGVYVSTGARESDAGPGWPEKPVSKPVVARNTWIVNNRLAGVLTPIFIEGNWRKADDSGNFSDFNAVTGSPGFPSQAWRKRGWDNHSSGEDSRAVDIPFQLNGARKYGRLPWAPLPERRALFKIGSANQPSGIHRLWRMNRVWPGF